MIAVVSCFLKGTLIWTPSGETRIEDLRVNDVVVTASGGATSIQWVWRRRLEREPAQKWDQKIVPIRVARSALGQLEIVRDDLMERARTLDA